MTYRVKEYFAMVRNKEDIKKSPFMLFVLSGSSKEKIEQELFDAGFAPFQNKLMTRQQFVKQDEQFFNRVGVINPEFEIESVLAISKFYKEQTGEAFDEVCKMYEMAKELGYEGSNNNTFIKLQNALVMA